MYDTYIPNIFFKFRVLGYIKMSQWMVVYFYFLSFIKYKKKKVYTKHIIAYYKLLVIISNYLQYSILSDRK